MLNFFVLKLIKDEDFEMAYDISASKKGSNSIWIAERHGVKQMMAWFFRRKVQEAMKCSEAHISTRSGSTRRRI